MSNDAAGDQEHGQQLAWSTKDTRSMLKSCPSMMVTLLLRVASRRYPLARRIGSRHLRPSGIPLMRVPNASLINRRGW